jgi:hypothetical protein
MGSARCSHSCAAPCRVPALSLRDTAQEMSASPDPVRTVREVFFAANSEEHLAGALAHFSRNADLGLEE